MFTDKEFLEGKREALELSYIAKHDESTRLYYEFQSKYFKKEIEEYKLLLNELVKMLRKLNLNSSLEYSMIIPYLIYNGYLSYNKNFSNNVEFEIDIQEGINIINGNGKCRHFASFHSDIFKLLNLYYEKYYCFYQRPFNRETLLANHVIGIVDYDNTLYGIDIGNKNDVYYFKNELELCKMYALLKRRLKYKAYINYILSNKNYEEILSTIERYGKESKKSRISLLELIQIRYNVLEIYESNKELFERFHRETQELKSDIYFGVRNKALELKKDFNIEADTNF